MINKRVVTVLKDGKSSISASTDHPRLHRYEHTPGFVSSILWGTDGSATTGQTDAALSVDSMCPAPGHTVFMTVTFPPDSVFADPNLDFGAIAAENAAHMAGLIEWFEPDAPGFHATPTVDYAIVTEGNLVLETDEGEIAVGPNDAIIQNGTRHAWRNRTDKPATIAVVLCGMPG